MPGMDMPGTPKSNTNNTKASNTPSLSIQNSTFEVSGNCDLCKVRIEKAAKSVAGVSGAVWDIKTKIIQVVFNAAVTTPDAIQKAIANAGHDTEKFKATNDAYNKLPECCLYRK